jgi:hypothetical protein
MFVCKRAPRRAGITPPAELTFHETLVNSNVLTIAITNHHSLFLLFVKEFAGFSPNMSPTDGSAREKGGGSEGP